MSSSLLFPRDVWEYEILPFSFGSPSEATNVALTCKLFKGALEKKHVWKPFFADRFKSMLLALTGTGRLPCTRYEVLDVEELVESFLRNTQLQSTQFLVQQMFCSLVSGFASRLDNVITCKRVKRSWKGGCFEAIGSRVHMGDLVLHAAGIEWSCFKPKDRLVGYDSHAATLFFADADFVFSQTKSFFVKDSKYLRKFTWWKGGSIHFQIAFPSFMDAMILGPPDAVLVPEVVLWAEGAVVVKTCTQTELMSIKQFESFECDRDVVKFILNLSNGSSIVIYETGGWTGEKGSGYHDEHIVWERKNGAGHKDGFDLLVKLTNKTRGAAGAEND